MEGYKYYFYRDDEDLPSISKIEETEEGYELIFSTNNVKDITKYLKDYYNYNDMEVDNYIKSFGFSYPN